MRVKLFKRKHGKAKSHTSVWSKRLELMWFDMVNQSQGEPLAAFYLCTFIVLAGER